MADLTLQAYVVQALEAAVEKSEPKPPKKAR